MKAARVGLGALALSWVACDAIPIRSLSDAPTNTCPENPCEAYRAGDTRARCVSRRCEFLDTQPQYPFHVVVSVPTTSFFAPGYTFVLAKETLFPTTPLTTTRCAPPLCTALPRLGQVTGSYVPTEAASFALGYPLGPQASIPIRVAFHPLLADGLGDPIARGLPLDATWGASRRFVDPTKEETDTTRESIAYVFPIPSGRYRRVAYPEPPYDAWFPPVESLVSVGNSLADNLVLGATAPIDDLGGETRSARVRRREGLSGWRVWLRDATSKRRISTLRSLTGVDAEVRLETSGQSQPGGGPLRDGVEAVVAPPDGYVAVPRLVSSLVGGSGLRNLSYPALPPPAAVNGVVAAPNPFGRLLSVPARLAIASTRITQEDLTDSPLLVYTTTVATDAEGRFATVLPPGTYDVVVEPNEGTGFAKFRQTVEVSGALALTVIPPLPAARVTGRAMAGDGRPLAEAEVFAEPLPLPSEGSLTGRPSRVVTGPDGAFSLELDRGRFLFTVMPKAGTGFPRAVFVRSIGAPDEDLGPLEVPAPMKLLLQIKDPRVNDTGPGSSPIDSPVGRAFVRVFAAPAAGTPEVEVGSAMTDSDGRCEILLPRSL